MIPNPSQELESYFPYSRTNEMKVINFLNTLTTIEFAFKMNKKKYKQLIKYFIDIKDEYPPNYFELPGIILLMQSFIAKLRLQTGVTKSPELKLLIRWPESITSRLLKISPKTVLKSLYQILYFSPNHSVAIPLLNQHPVFYIRMIIMQRHQNMILRRAVSNPIGLKLLAKKLSTQEFLREFSTNDLLKIPPLITTTDGDQYYAKINDSKLRIFTIVAESLIRSASMNNELDYLCLNGPKELLSLLKDIIISLASMNHLPQCIIPYISAISSRFSPSILGRIREPDSLIKAIKLFLLETPQLLDSVATMVIESPHVWHELSIYINDLPELNIAIRNYIPYMLQIDQEACFDFLTRIHTTDKAAVSAINFLKPFIPKSYLSIMNLSKSGELSFRVAAGIAASEDSLWIQLAQYFHGRDQYMSQFLDISTDLIISGNFYRALELLNYLSIYYSAGSKTINLAISEYIYQKYASFPLNCYAEQSLFAEVFGRVHKFSSSIIPVLQKMPKLTSKCLLLLIRFLWNAMKDDDPSFLIFRLKLFIKRIGTKKEPRQWTYEIIVNS
ncbi:hypothetical protein M9Y10_012711 [Tritrichomonas musculus]|uniref:Uncharacterized protein n=1 Tax=Tritrichomonas musculus TaxID=1915356 RepID=A0ABR2IE71_9EUKA